MMDTKRSGVIFKGAALVAAACLMLTACSGGGSGEGAQGDRKIVIAQTADVRSLFANSTTVQSEVNVTAQMTEKLIEFTPDGTDFEPRLATEWKQVDPLTTELTLREGVSFTNGEKFDAESAKFSIETMLAAKIYAPYTSAIASVEVISDHVIAVTSNTPSMLVLTSLAIGSFQYPQKYFNDVGEEGFAAAPIGTGPLVLDKWSKGVSITFTANDDYWNGPLGFDEVEYRIIPEKSAQVTALQSGEVDFVSDLPIGSAQRIEQSDDLQLVQRPSNRVWSVIINTLADGPLKSKEVRRALKYAIDVNALVDGPLSGFGSPLEGQLPPDNFFGFVEGLKAADFNPAKAKQLLAEAGYPDGFTVKFQYSANDRKEVTQVIASQLEAVGIKVEQELLEPGTFIEYMVGGKLEGIFTGGLLTPPDAHFIYSAHTSEYPYSYYANPALDELIQEELNTADAAERQGVFEQIVEVLDDDPAFVPTYRVTDLYGIANSIEGFEPRASQFLDVSALKRS